MADYNNINVWHKGTKISIAQHWDKPSDSVAHMQEVGIIPDDGDWGNMTIKNYAASLDHLIQVLEGIRDEIDYKIHNESSGKGDARTAQTATGSAT